MANREKATLLIAKLDRLSRNASFIFSLRDSGVKFECCDIPEANTLNIGIFAKIAQNERELTSERTKKALQAKKDQGFVLGNPENLTDQARMKGSESNRLKAENCTANRMAGAFAGTLKDRGMSYNEIVNELNKNGFRTPGGSMWIGSSIFRILKRKRA
jgi:DNA invertase Pin-like site-specific DNA recombinase